MAHDSIPRVCISAGHGSGSRKAGQVDPGAQVIGPGTESDVTLRVAKSVVLDLRVLFAAKKRGKAYLRDKGLFYLADDYAVAKGCDVFVELHTDAAGKKATGVTAIHEGAYSARFAADMASKVSAALGIKNRGAKNRTDLAVLNPHVGLKAVLLEMFFGTSAIDVAAYKRNYNALVLAIVNAILVNRGWKKVTKRPSKMSKVALRLYKPY